MHLLQLLNTKLKRNGTKLFRFFTELSCSHKQKLAVTRDPKQRSQTESMGLSVAFRDSSK